MPIHLDSLLGDDFNTQHWRNDGLQGDTVNLDDLLDFDFGKTFGTPGELAKAGLKGLGHLVGVPERMPHTPTEALHDIATNPLTAPVMGAPAAVVQLYDMLTGAEHAKQQFERTPTRTGKAQALISQVPMVGEPIAELMGPSVASAEERPQRKEENLQAVTGGTTAAGLVLMPKVIKGVQGKIADVRGMAEGSGFEEGAGLLGETPEKPVAPRIETRPGEAERGGEVVNLDDLLAQAGEAQEAARSRPPQGTDLERIKTALEEQQQRMAAGAEGDIRNPRQFLQDARAAKEAGASGERGISLDELVDRGRSEEGGPAPEGPAQPIEAAHRFPQTPAADIAPDETRTSRQNITDPLAFLDAIDDGLRESYHAGEKPTGPAQAQKPITGETWPKDTPRGVSPEWFDYEDAKFVRDDAGNVHYAEGEEDHEATRAKLFEAGLLGDTRAKPEGTGFVKDGIHVDLDDLQHAKDFGQAFVRKAVEEGRLIDPRVAALYPEDVPPEQIAPAKVLGAPRYPWANKIQVPTPRETAGQPAPRQASIESGGSSDWIDDLPEAASGAPPQEPPTPPLLADEIPGPERPQSELPARMTSEPAPSPADKVRDMIGSDAERELVDAAGTRNNVMKYGSAALKKASQIFNALVVPGDDVLLRSGNAGQEAVRVTRPIELVRAQAVGKADALYHDIAGKLTPKERAGVALILDGQLDPTSANVTPAMLDAAVRVRRFLNEYLDRARAAGTGVERKENFFPHYREAPIHDIEKPLPEFQKFGMESPSFHFHQVDKRPGYSQDLGYVMRRYAYNAETELQAIRAFGAADAESILAKINEWSGKIAAQGGDGVLAKKILLEKFNMHDPELPSMRSASRDVAAAVGSLNTVTTSIRHLGKYVNGLTQMGFRGVAKGLTAMAQALVDPAARQRIRESGVLLRNSFDLVMPNSKETAFYRVMRALPWVKATKAMDAGGRVMMYFGADPWIDETVAIARGDRTYMGSVTKGMQRRAVADAYNRAHNIFGISEESLRSGKITPEEREYARLAASDVSEFSPEKGQLPYAATVGAAGRLFYNLRKFATSQANFMYNNVIKPATFGNYKPMARFLAFSAVSGAIQEPLLHLVNRQPDAVLNYFGIPLRPEGDQSWDDWAKKAMATGAIHNLGLIYLLVEGRDIMQAVPMASAGLLGRGVHGAVKDFVNASRVSLGVPSEDDKEGVDLPQWWDQASTNLRDLEGRNVKDIARSTQLTWLMRKWYREARGLEQPQSR